VRSLLPESPFPPPTVPLSFVALILATVSCLLPLPRPTRAYLWRRALYLTACAVASPPDGTIQRLVGLHSYQPFSVSCQPHSAAPTERRKVEDKGEEPPPRISGKMAGELWQMARDWLGQLKVLPPDSPANAAKARVYDLALALQDGTVLCNSLNRIIPGAIETVHERPEKQFLKMQNINAFLEAARKFGLKEGDLFTVDQLYYASDFQKVITAISTLSNAPQCKGAGFRPFPEGGAAKNTANEGGEDMYQSLEDLVGQNISFQDAAASASAAYDPDDEDDEDIYGSIRKVVEDSGVGDVYSDVLYNSKRSVLAEGPAAGDEEDIYTPVSNPDDKRNHVLMELVETEKNYVGVLDIIITKFKVALGKSKLPRSDLDLIFSNVEDLYHVHNDFKGALEKEMGSRTGRKVSKPFLEYTGMMKVYGRFCCDVPQATKKLTEMAGNSKMQKILDGAKRDSNQRFALKDLLNVPMQRLLKYPLLLKELNKHTGEAHPDKVGLKTAMDEVKALAVFINQYKSDYETLQNITKSLKKYKGKPLSHFAPLKKDGDLKMKKDDGKDKLKDSYVFLLEGAVIVTRQLKVSYEHRELIELTAAMEVVDVPFWNLQKEEQSGKYTFAWALKSGSTGHVFAAKSLVAKKKWMQLMNEALLVAKEKAGVAPAPVARGAAAAGAAVAAAGAARPPSVAKPPPKKASAKPSAKKAGGKQAYEEWVIPSKPPPDEGGAASEGASRAGGGDEGWFGGKIQRPKAEKILQNAPDGTFLVRESHTRQGDYSLSVKYASNCKHIKINRTGNQYDLAPDAISFNSIQELVEHFQSHSLNRHFPGMETTLAIPFKDAIGRGMNGSMFGQEKQVGIGRARSRFAYQAKSHDELTFERGIEIIILSMHDQDPGWWKGQLPNGTIGIFPANYVQRL